MKTLAFFFALMAPVFGRLGESRQECEVRYGANVSHTVTVSQFLKNGIAIEISFRNDKAARIKFSVKSDTLLGEKLSDFKVSEILKANDGGSPWQVTSKDLAGKKLSRVDGSALATWNYVIGDLELVTAAEKKLQDDSAEASRRAEAAFQRAEAARKAAAEKKSVEGF
jgi:hypothetical protein